MMDEATSTLGVPELTTKCATLEKRLVELQVELRETESELHNFQDLLEMERAAIEELRRNFASHLIASGGLAAVHPLEDPEVFQLVYNFQGYVVERCSSCKKRRPLRTSSSLPVCVWCTSRTG